jgi:CRP-like cAMP-binding protein
VADAADLAGIPLFAALSNEERVALAPWFESATISPGVALVTEGAAGYSFYVLVDGAAVVTLDGEEVATYNPGDFFGEMAILGEGRRYATVTTTEPSRVLSMFGTDFRRLQQEQPDVAARLEEAMRKRALELDELRATASPGAL